jgi:excisionase family DNA binding protein
MADLAAQLRQLADRLAELAPAEIVGALEALKFEVWTSAPPAPIAAPPADERPPLTVAAVARRIGFSTDVVYEMLRRGELSNVGRGRAKRVAAVAVDAWLARPPSGWTASVDPRYSSPHVPRRRSRAAHAARAHAEGARRRARRGDNDGRPVGTRRPRRQRPGAHEPDAPGAATWALPPVRRRSGPPTPPEP